MPTTSWASGFDVVPDAAPAGVVLALQVVHRYAGPGLVQLQCYGLLEPTLTQIKLTAVRVAKLKNQSVGG